MEKEPEKAEGEAEPVSGQSVASDLTYEEARALSAPVREEPPAVPEEAQIESAQPASSLVSETGSVTAPPGAPQEPRASAGAAQQ